jgi:hypothetical protein
MKRGQTVLSFSIRSATSSNSDVENENIIVDKAVDRDQAILFAGEAIRDWFTNHEEVEGRTAMLALADTVIRCSKENSKLVTFLQNFKDR